MSALTTKISIVNSALQLLGSQSIASLQENSRGAKAMLRAYDSTFLAELRANTWNFAIKRALLVADAAAPIFGKPRSFPLPGDFLYLAAGETTFSNPKRHDYQIEGNSIFTSEVSPLPIRYVSSNLNESDFDPLFATAFAISLAVACCEEVTNSNTKKADLKADYKETMGLARKRNAMENSPVKSPTCSFITVRQ